MQLCHCGSESPEGALFCEDCGMLLVEVPAGYLTGTTTIIKKNFYNDERDNHDADDIFPRGGMLVFSIGNEQLRLSIDGQFVLGRNVSDDTDSLVIDLSRYGAEERGVSRRHAGIFRTREGILQVSDLGSSNGTFINGLRLQENQFYSLNHGDILSLGKLDMNVRFEVPEKPVF